MLRPNQLSGTEPSFILSFTPVFLSYCATISKCLVTATGLNKTSSSDSKHTKWPWVVQSAPSCHIKNDKNQRQADFNCHRFCLLGNKTSCHSRDVALIFPLIIQNFYSSEKKNHCTWHKHKINIFLSFWQQSYIFCQKKVVNLSCRTHLALMQFVIPIGLIYRDSSTRLFDCHLQWLLPMTEATKNGSLTCFPQVMDYIEIGATNVHYYLETPEGVL